MLRSLQTLRARFFSGNRYLHSLGGVTISSTPGGSSHWIVSRGFSSYHLVDLGNIQKDKRTEALENQLELLSPYERFGSWVSWTGGRAQVWVWDAALVDAAIQEHLVEPDDLALIDVVPETAFTEKPSDGILYLKGLDGFIAQFWEAGVLLRERHWLQEPSEQEMQLFMRGVGVVPDVAEQPLVELDFSSAPWRDENLLNFKVRQYEPNSVLAACLIFSAVLVFQLSTFITLELRNWWLASEITSLTQDLEPVMEVREKTFERFDTNRALDILDARKQLEYMTMVLNVLPEGQESRGRLQKWAFKDNEISINVTDPIASLESYASALDQVAEFSRVSLEVNERTRFLTIQVTISE